MLLQQMAYNLREPDVMVTEPAAIACRVATSFIRVGHLDLFARRVRKEVPNVTAAEREEDARIGLEQLRQMVQFSMFREFPDAKTPLEMLEQSGRAIATMTANWIRVGFCQGNFNSDNCLISGTQMDYGPFGFIERFEAKWNMWTGGGEHFSFMNQMVAGSKNFETLVKSVKPALKADEQDRADSLVFGHFAIATDALNDVWRRKLGLPRWTQECNVLISEILLLLEETKADYTMFWRQLAHVAASGNEGLEPLESAFYEPLNEASRHAWQKVVHTWLDLLRQQAAIDSAPKLMRETSPKYVPREWMLVQAYEKAYEGDYSLIHELHQLFLRPFDEQPDFEDKYYRKAPQEVYEGVVGKPGTAFMT